MRSPALLRLTLGVLLLGLGSASLHASEVGELRAGAAKAGVGRGLPMAWPCRLLPLASLTSAGEPFQAVSSNRYSPSNVAAKLALLSHNSNHSIPFPTP